MSSIGTGEEMFESKEKLVKRSAINDHSYPITLGDFIIGKISARVSQKKLRKLRLAHEKLKKECEKEENSVGDAEEENFQPVHEVDEKYNSQDKATHFESDDKSENGKEGIKDADEFPTKRINKKRRKHKICNVQHLKEPTYKKNSKGSEESIYNILDTSNQSFKFNNEDLESDFFLYKSKIAKVPKKKFKDAYTVISNEGSVYKILNIAKQEKNNV